MLYFYFTCFRLPMPLYPVGVNSSTRYVYHFIFACITYFLFLVLVCVVTLFFDIRFFFYFSSNILYFFSFCSHNLLWCSFFSLFSFEQKREKSMNESIVAALRVDNHNLQMCVYIYMYMCVFCGHY